MFKCHTCDKTYAFKKTLKRHDRQVHGIYVEVQHECKICNVLFTSKRKLQHHHSEAHKQKANFVVDLKEPVMPYKCHDCGLTCDNKTELIDHVKIHKIFSRKKNALCPLEECQEVFRNYINLHSHLTVTHNISISEEKYEFRSEVEFNKWKKEKEQELKAYYVIKASAVCAVEGARTYYKCHRSSAARSSDVLKRNAKSVGSNKIGRTCPSVLIATSSAESISVLFYPTHIGHIQELGRLRIAKEDRNKIAGKLSQGVPVERVLNDIRESVPHGQIRIHLLEKKDIHNIMRDYSIAYSTKRHNNDAVSVKLWVQSMKKLEQDPVLYYKEQGEIGDSTFREKDFVLIIMTEFQENSLILFGNKKICIDGTHGLNQYEFQLFTIMVVDEYGCGIPAAFCFANRSDVILFKIFFQCIKDRVGLLTPNIFMSDDFPAFYLAWECIMGKVTQVLLCTWHINKNWLQNSNKIVNKEKRTLVLKSMKVLQKELDEKEFLKQLKTLVTQLMCDPDTYKFYQYFSRTYLNRTHMWAYCYRKYSGINTNMYLESLHKVIKHFYLQGKQCKRLDKIINALMQLVRDKMFERIIKLEKHKITEKIQKILASHKRGDSIPDIYINQSTFNTWHVVSTHDSNHTYLVEKIASNCIELCELKCSTCKICVHTFKCSCPDNVINHNICKHIHACCIRHLRENATPTMEMESAPVYNIERDLISSTSDSSYKSLIDDKLQIIIGLNNKIMINESNAKQVAKQLDNIINTYNSSDPMDFVVKEKVNIVKNIEPQVRMFSHKSKKPRLSKHDHTYPQPYENESKVIKFALSNPDASVLNIQTGSDHNY